MMRFTIFIFSIVLLCGFSASAPKRDLCIKTKHDFFSTDNLGNIYTVNDDELIKYLPNGKLFARYSNLKFGTISSIDVTNPLKILLYYRSYQQIVFLDNQLSTNSDAVALESLGLEQTDLVCAGSNNSFWIYNKQNNELLRFNELSKKIASTGNLKQILASDLNPDFMIEHNNFLYLNSPEAGIYVFDMFGAYSKLVALRNLHSFQISDNQVYFKRDSMICRYDQVLLEDNCERITEGPLPRSVRVFGTKRYLGYKDSVLVISK
jgi:hypothetical protein